MTDPVAKITCRHVPLDCVIIIRICRHRRDMNKLWHFLGDMRHPPSASLHDFGMIGTIDFSHSSTLSFNRSSTVQAAGRPRSSWACCTAHVSTNSSHNASESPEGGLFGRPPSLTLSITVSIRLTSSNGTHPVRTYQEIDSVFFSTQ